MATTEGAWTPAPPPSFGVGTRPCPSCARDWGVGMACQFCGQVAGAPSGVRLSTPARRFAGWFLDWVLIFATLFVGYLIWMGFTLPRGQTPAKQVLGMRVMRLRTATKAGLGTMFVRDVVAKPVTAVLSFLTFGIIDFMLLWDANNQQPWDKMAGTIVVDDRHKQLLAS